MQMTIDAIRFLSNSLPTSHRMHSSGITVCPFCFRPKGDSMQHFVQCRLLLHELSRASGYPKFFFNSPIRCVVGCRIVHQRATSALCTRTLVSAVLRTFSSCDIRAISHCASWPQPTFPPANCWSLSTGDEELSSE